MLCLAYSAATLSIDGDVVRVEADRSPGSPTCTIRVRSAIFNSGFAYPAGRLLVNLSPADVRMEGPAFDLAIALGELTLDGSLRNITGIFPMVLGARVARANYCTYFAYD